MKTSRRISWRIFFVAVGLLMTFEGFAAESKGTFEFPSGAKLNFRIGAPKKKAPPLVESSEKAGLKSEAKSPRLADAEKAGR